MSRKFLKVCDGVNLIISPCEYKGFNLKLGMMLFDADTPDRHITGLDVPFVATKESEGFNSDKAYGRLTNKIVLDGFELRDDDILYGSADIELDTDRQTKILNAVDLGLGEAKLYNLFLADKDTKYTKECVFSVYDPNTRFNSTYSHVIDNVFLQKTGDNFRDKLVTLSRDQVDAFNNLSPYGIVNYSRSSLYMFALRDEEDACSFHNFIVAYNKSFTNTGFAKDDVNEIVDTIRQNCNVVDVSDARCDDSRSIYVTTKNVLVSNGFNMKPFTVSVSPQFAKDNLDHVLWSYGEYEYDDISEYIVDDGIHNVYLTSINGYDTWDYDERDSSNVVYNGFYFDGYDFKLACFSCKDDVSSDLSGFIYQVMRESKHTHIYLSDIDNYEELDNDVKTRLSKLDDELSSDDYDRINTLYTDYLSKRRDAFDNPIVYEKLTDSELHSKVSDDMVDISVLDTVDYDDVSEHEF